MAGLDLRAGPAPSLAPRPPFRFVREELHGPSPKVLVKDAAGRQHVAKFGSEVHAEVFAARLVWACGYQVEPAFYVARVRVERLQAASVGGERAATRQASPRAARP
ncbi:MAG TPA: hypothetical protein VEQ10_22060 [Vicinamibacteria bacterium]|nr:hypothetical protein [Vicinamibacteria bacterium]